MNYEKAYKQLREEVIGTVNGYRTFLETNTEFEYLDSYRDAKAQCETLEKLEKIIIHNEEHVV